MPPGSGVDKRKGNGMPKNANAKVARRARMRHLDATCRRVGFPRTDKGGGSGRLGTRRHVGDMIVMKGRC